MAEVNCSICLENLMNPDQNRGGAFITACGHPFHRYCIEENVRRNFNCPICRAFVVLREMNPLFLPPDDVRQPHHNNVYQNLIINRNGRQILNLDNARLVIYPIQPVNNQMVVSIEVREINVGQNQNHQINLNGRRRSVQPQRLNYSRLHCIFCNRLMTTNDGSVICDGCLAKEMMN